MWPVFVFLKEIIALWCQLHWALYQEKLNVHSWMIFCPDRIIPDSGLTGLNNIYIYIYIYRILSPVKPELGVIPSGQEIIREWIFKSSW